MESSNSRTLILSRILHAGYIVDFAGKNILIDPIFENPFSENCYAYPMVEFDHEQIKKLQPDAVFISHYHDDHCSFVSLNLLDKNTPIYVYCLHEELFCMLEELGFTHVHSLKLNSPIQIGSIEITPLRALDADVDSIFHIKAGDYNLLNVVDSWIDDDTLHLLSKTAKWDMILWPFQTMREIEVLAPRNTEQAAEHLPEEWIAQLKILKPKILVPSSCQFSMESWSWYNQAFFPITYAQFQKEIEQAVPEIKVMRMNPSVSIELKNGNALRSSALPWIKPIGEQDVDYDYQAHALPTHTSEIAKQFRPLESWQLEKVLQFCQSDLLTELNSMELPTDDYFAKQRHWRLLAYNHLGEAVKFDYELKDGKLSFLRAEDTEVSWLTEIPISKLYNALEKGEALTSLYIRINDMSFPSEIENEIRNADVLQDPLIRCLYSGKFGAYQTHQLKRIALEN